MLARVCEHSAELGALVSCSIGTDTDHDGGLSDGYRGWRYIGSAFETSLPEE